MGGSTKPAQPILYFFCRPCAEYHLKTHPHFKAAKDRSAKRRRAITQGKKPPRFGR